MVRYQGLATRMTTRCRTIKGMWVRLLKGYLYRNIGIAFVKEKRIYTYVTTTWWNIDISKIYAEHELFNSDWFRSIERRYYLITGLEFVLEVTENKVQTTIIYVVSWHHQGVIPCNTDHVDVRTGSICLLVSCVSMHELGLEIDNLIGDFGMGRS